MEGQNVITATLNFAPAETSHESFYVCQILGDIDTNVAVNVFVDPGDYWELFIHTSSYPSIQSYICPTHPFIHPSIHPSSIHSHIRTSFYPISFHLFIHVHLVLPPTYLSIHSFIHPFVHSFVHLSFHLYAHTCISMHLSIHPSIQQCLLL